jgi:hypothetical protein
MNKTIAALAITVGALLAGTAHADPGSSYMRCITLNMQHLGYGTPATDRSWVQLGRSIRESVQQDNVPPQQEMGVIERLGWNEQTANAILLCALGNGPI